MAEQTTLEQRMAADREVRDAMLFERMIENFVKTWCPKDGYDKARFVAELMGIVRQTTLDVQKQLNEQTMSVMRTLANAHVLTRFPGTFYDPPKVTEADAKASVEDSQARRNPMGTPGT